MNITSAEFVLSNADVSKCPNRGIPEYAFIGRSNIGKSSLINMLTGRKTLAKTSSRPGKTRLINHFLINDSWFLVDLPGYGYARTSKSSKKTFQKFITDYFQKRTQLTCTFVLIDIRHEPQDIDMEFMVWLAKNRTPFVMVFTKADKEKPNARKTKISRYESVMKETFWEEMPLYFVTSVLHKTGREEILEFIEQTNLSLRQ